MESNIIKAIVNLVNNPIIEINEYYKSKNRANNMGESLEEYVKDLFAGTINVSDEKLRNIQICSTFSYLGNQNNPPDIILKDGDAVEVKKIENRNSTLALNSSYPKHKLYVNNPMITEACRKCENWTEKDIIYTVGVINNNYLSDLCMVYGMDYAASEEVYLKIRNIIRSGINSIPDVEFADTRELGRVNRVDPLGITYLRIRGMWGIENPIKVFEYIYTRDENKKFNFMALINEEKFKTLKYTEDLISLKNKNENFDIKDVEIKNPDNPAQLRKAKLITFSI